MSDIDLMKRQIEVQLSEYETAIAEYAAFMDDWRRRNPQRLPMFSEEAGITAQPESAA